MFEFDTNITNICNSKLYKNYFWLPKDKPIYKVIPKNLIKFKYNNSFTEMIEKYTFYKLLINIIKITSLYKGYDTHGVYICGSTILSVLMSEKISSDIDIILIPKYKNAERYYIAEFKQYIITILKNIIKIKSIKYTIQKQSQLRYSLSIEYKNQIFNFDIFTIIGNVSELVRHFHLPCVRALYNIKTKKLLCYMSFVRSLLTGLCFNARSKCYGDKNKVINVYTKYFKRGFGYIFNEMDKNKFINELKCKGIKYKCEIMLL
jgi:hypothetical protein